MTTSEILDHLTELESEQHSQTQDQRERADVCRRHNQPNCTAHYTNLSAIAARRAEALEAAIAIIKNEN